MPILRHGGVIEPAVDIVPVPEGAARGRHQLWTGDVSLLDEAIDLAVAHRQVLGYLGSTHQSGPT